MKNVKITFPKTVWIIACTLFIANCTKQDKSTTADNDAQTVARSVLVKVSFTDSNFTVPIEVASALAVNIDKIMPKIRMPESLDIEKSFTVNDSLGRPNMYIFNFKGDGYAIFSADERYDPLLAVVANGKYENREAPGGLIMWLDHTMDNINLAKAGKIGTWKSTKAA